MADNFYRNNDMICLVNAWNNIEALKEHLSHWSWSFGHGHSLACIPNIGL